MDFPAPGGPDNQTTLPRLRNGIFLPKLFRPTVWKNCSSDWEKLLKFEAACREFQKVWDL